MASKIYEVNGDCGYTFRYVINEVTREKTFVSAYGSDYDFTTVHKSITRIGPNAFKGTKLTEVHFRPNVNSVDDNAFEGSKVTTLVIDCYGLNSTDVNKHFQYALMAKGITYVVLENYDPRIDISKTLELFQQEKPDTTIDIRFKETNYYYSLILKGTKLVNIDDNLHIKNLLIPEGVKSVDRRAYNILASNFFSSIRFPNTIEINNVLNPILCVYGKNTDNSISVLEIPNGIKNTLNLSQFPLDVLKICGPDVGDVWLPNNTSLRLCCPIEWFMKWNIEPQVTKWNNIELKLDCSNVSCLNENGKINKDFFISLFQKLQGLHATNKVYLYNLGELTKHQKFGTFGLVGGITGIAKEFRINPSSIEFDNNTSIFERTPIEDYDDEYTRKYSGIETNVIQDTIDEIKKKIALFKSSDRLLVKAYLEKMVADTKRQLLESTDTSNSKVLTTTGVKSSNDDLIDNLLRQLRELSNNLGIKNAKVFSGFQEFHIFENITVTDKKDDTLTTKNMVIELLNSSLKDELLQLFARFRIQLQDLVDLSFLPGLSVTNKMYLSSIDLEIEIHNLYKKMELLTWIENCFNGNIANVLTEQISRIKSIEFIGQNKQQAIINALQSNMEWHLYSHPNVTQDELLAFGLQQFSIYTAELNVDLGLKSVEVIRDAVNQQLETLTTAPQMSKQTILKSLELSLKIVNEEEHEIVEQPIFEPDVKVLRELILGIQNQEQSDTYFQRLRGFLTTWKDKLDSQDDGEFDGFRVKLDIFSEISTLQREVEQILDNERQANAIKAIHV